MTDLNPEVSEIESKRMGNSKMAAKNEVSFEQIWHDDQDLIQLSQFQCLDQIGKIEDAVADPTFVLKSVSFVSNENSFEVPLLIKGMDGDKWAEEKSFAEDVTKTLGNTVYYHNFGHDLRDVSTTCNEPSPFPTFNKQKLVSSAKRVPNRNVKAIKKSDNLVKTNSNRIQGKQEISEHSVKCPHCLQIFPKHQSLGGHMSKIHRGMSTTFNLKKNTREKNTEGRLMLKKAKQLFYERTNKESK